MKEEFLNYLNVINVTDVLQERVSLIIDSWVKCLPNGEDIQDIFLCDYVNEEGNRINENLWLFSQNFIGEAETIISEEKFDLVKFTNNITRWEINNKNYDFINSIQSSRLSIEISFLEEISGEFKASSNNCNYLNEIFMKYFKNNFN